MEIDKWIEFTLAIHTILQAMDSSFIARATIFQTMDSSFIAWTMYSLFVFRLYRVSAIWQDITLHPLLSRLYCSFGSDESSTNTVLLLVLWCVWKARNRTIFATSRPLVRLESQEPYDLRQHLSRRGRHHRVDACTPPALGFSCSPPCRLDSDFALVQFS